MKIRNYSVHDRQSCLQVLDGNTPEFFVPKDRDDFSRFIDNLPGPYFVIEDRGIIVACGGWAMDAEEVAALTWGMVRRDLHRQVSDVTFFIIDLRPFGPMVVPRLCDFGRFHWCKSSLPDRGSTSLMSYRTDMERGWTVSRWPFRCA